MIAHAAHRVQPHWLRHYDQLPAVLRINAGRGCVLRVGLRLNTERREPRRHQHDGAATVEKLRAHYGARDAPASCAVPTFTRVENSRSWLSTTRASSSPSPVGTK